MGLNPGSATSQLYDLGKSLNYSVPVSCFVDKDDSFSLGLTWDSAFQKNQPQLCKLGNLHFVLQKVFQAPTSMSES